MVLNPFGPRLTVSEITALRIYPIKSCRGISIPSTTLTRRGLALDRNWMFATHQTDADLPFSGLTFITIRQKSQMTLIDTAFSPDGEELLISIRDHPDAHVSIPTHPSPAWLAANTTIQTVNIWSTLTDGYVFGPEINSVFTPFFGEDVSLVYKGPTPRICGGNGSKAELGREESVNFPDVLPVQIASEASLEELNGRLREKGERELTVERFRPNVIVKGDVPWSEDSWKTVRINGGDGGGFLGSLLGTGGNPEALDLDVVARCARCQVPNVDPDTAEKHKKEPWTTLMSYRRVDPGITFKPCFGMLCCPRSEGEIAVGMKFEVLESTNNHAYKKGF